MSKPWNKRPETKETYSAYREVKLKKKSQKEIMLSKKKAYETYESILRCEEAIREENNNSPKPQLKPEECNKAVRIAAKKRDKAKAQYEEAYAKYREIKSRCHEKWQGYQKAYKEAKQ